MKKDKAFIKKLVKMEKSINMLSITGIYSLFEAKNTPEFYFDGECHSPWELVYVMDGSVGITADDKIYTLTSGDIILHKPMEFHKIWSANGTSPRVLICSFDLEGSLTNRIGGIYHISNEAKVIIDSLLVELYTEYNKSPSELINFLPVLDKNKTIVQIVFKKLEIILLYLSGLNSEEQKCCHNENISLYTKIAEILEEHIYDKITISQISEICNVSTATIKNCFKEYTGCGIHKYFLNIKIRAAIEMLKNGMNVNQVSDTLQFANPNYFSYVFKRETGMCASTFKKL